ncbi:phosphoglycolate phosphatase [Rheinheimera marina]|uniref:Phosphoglycolate phosphatase n=1 Tax=Rheinheimera marina TaxID=1774958 RepID=A0ABV9JMX6_9GAMM
MTALRCIAFDLDGTLVDSAPDILPALNQTLAQLGLAPVGLEQVQHWLGNGMLMLLKRALTGEMQPCSVDLQLLEQAKGYFIEHYHQTNGQHTVLFPGVKEVLSELSQSYRLAVTTNKPRQFSLPLLESLGIAPYFSQLVCADEVAKAKPAPDMLLKLAELEQLAPTQLLLVGDSENDIFAARAAALPVFALSYGYNHGQSIELSQPDLVLDDFRQLPQAIRQYVQEC